MPRNALFLLKNCKNPECWELRPSPTLWQLEALPGNFKLFTLICAIYNDVICVLYLFVTCKQTNKNLSNVIINDFELKKT